MTSHSNPRKDSILGSYYGGLLQQMTVPLLSALSIWGLTEIRHSKDWLGLALLLAAAPLAAGSSAYTLFCVFVKKKMTPKATFLSNLAMATAGSCLLIAVFHLLWLSTSVHPGGSQIFLNICLFEVCFLLVVTLTSSTATETVKAAVSWLQEHKTNQERKTNQESLK